MEDAMKRERALQVVLVLVGLIYSSLGYFLFQVLWHSRWLNGHNDVLPMFLILNTVLGVFLLLAVKHPAKHRSLIAYGAWSSLGHAFMMTIQSAEAAAHGMHRKDSPQDIVMFCVIGVALLVLLPPKEPARAPAPISEPRFAEL
jgi:glucose uptake protein GlcU